MPELSWISLLPPVLAIILAIWSRQVYISLLAGIYLGWTIINGWNPLSGFASTLEALVRVFEDGGNAKIIVFCGLVGALITLMHRSAGVDGFINFVTRRNWLKSRRSAQLVSGAIGSIIFVETSISSLIVGSISRPIFDRKKISREKLAYICDSTSAPINLLIPLNGWGAFIIGLLTQEKITNPVAVMAAMIPFNFYSVTALLLVFLIIMTGKDFGPMKKAESRVKSVNSESPHHLSEQVSPDSIQVRAKPGVSPRISNMLIPVLTMILMMPLGLLITGKGYITQGSGSTSVYWAVVAAVIVAAVMYRGKKILSLSEISQLVVRGIGGMVPVMVLMMFAFAIGDVTHHLHTGLYVANLAKLFVNPALIPLALFLISAFIAFSTGTSWGTYAIIVPIGIAISSNTGIHLPLVLAAVLGGGLFGDHSSPISDTTIIASMASFCDHIEHVRTQLPYALAAAILSGLLYLIAGIALN